MKTIEVYVMNTWHPGNQSDILCQILKFKISMKLRTVAYTWLEKKNIYISGPSSIKIKTIRARNDASLYFQELRATQLLRQANKTIKTAGYQIP